MAAAEAPKQPDAESTNLYQACKECKKKRTLCIRVRRPNQWNPKDFGHANLSVLEEGQKPVTYGNWPSEGKGTDVRKDDDGDDPTKDKRFKDKDIKCKEMSEEEEKKLEQELAKKQKYDYFDNNCARWSGGTWNSVTGDSLDYGAGNTVYNSPTTLGNSMNP